jgi:hypothetical protein
MLRSLQGIPYFSRERRGCAEHHPAHVIQLYSVQVVNKRPDTSQDIHYISALAYIGTYWKDLSRSGKPTETVSHEI